MKGDNILNDQVAYYRARAAEYDEWHMRQSRFDRGEAHRKQWSSELASIHQLIDKAGSFGDCLELACGTGLWTPQLEGCATRLTAVDAVGWTGTIKTTGDFFIFGELTV